MLYQRVEWYQSSQEFPSVLYSEIDAEGWEVRKVDEYADGRLDIAAAGIETGRTFLGLVPVPPLDEINGDPQFEGVEISADEFEIVWERATSKPHGAPRPEL